MSSSSTVPENSPEEIADERIEEDKVETRSLAAYLREEVKEDEAPTVNIETQDWNAEVEHVKEQLREEQKQDQDSYSFRIRRMRKYLDKLKSLTNSSGNQVIQNYVYFCENALNTIAINEKQLNKTANQKLLEEMRDIREIKIEAAHELIAVRNKVKEQIDTFDIIVDKCNGILV